MLTYRCNKQRVYEILTAAHEDDRASRIFGIFIVTLIGLNVVAFVLDTVESIHTAAGVYFWWFEVGSVAIFTIEYILRLWSCSASYIFRGRVRFMLTPMAIVDLLAILPFYLALTTVDLRVIRVLRMFRLFRIAKMGRYTQSLQLLGRVVKNQAYELAITIAFTFILILLASSFLYFAEKDAQPEVFSSIPAAMWCAVATLTTVGFSDISPVTTVGKTLGAIIAVLGIGMIALPTGILGGGFVEELRKREKPTICSKCGEGEKDVRSFF